MTMITQERIPIIVQSLEANRWEIGYYRVDNTIGVEGGVTLTIQMYVMNQTGPSTFQNLTPLPLQVYSGPELDAILTRAGELFETYRGQAVDLKTAYYLCTRDALYERLKLDGIVPNNAAEPGA